MAGVPDIPVVKQVVDRISDAAADAIFRGFRYLFCYKKLVDDLKSEMKNVKNEEDKVNQETVQERANGNTIKPHVVKWQKEAKEFQESAEEFSERYKNRASWTCLKCLPIPNPISRFRLGREAAQKTTMATDLVKDGEKLLTNQIADPPPIDDLPNPAVEFEDFESRKSVYGQLWEALVTEGSSRILGIYGMAGVGKTRMMEQLWKESMEEKKFDKVVRANVGRNVGSEVVNVIKLQEQIAADLNCKFEPEDNKNRRAAKLKNSLMNSKKVLVIFDDVWSEIPIENIIGTDFGESSDSKGSKILLTSRSEGVCLKNKCQRRVEITSLTKGEAWDLFQKTVGTDHINDLHDDDLAKKVCAKCAGLPLLIRAVGKALEFMSLDAWNNALIKLEKGNFKDIPEIDPQVYACVKWSIDALQEETKLCLFLCSLFPEDADIHIKTLIQFAIGSHLILDGEFAIPTMVDVLTKSSLLLECDKNHITRMHDIIRDVSRLEASEGSNSRLTDNAGYSTSKKLLPKLLRLDVEGGQVRFPDSEYLAPKDLNTLWLHCNNHLQQFPGGFFDMFVNLGFLILQKVHSLPEHFSLEPLGKLKMLIFDGCDLRKTDVGLFPKNLNTLCIWDCDLPSPLDLSTLNNLLRLDIQQKYGEVVMVRNAISSLCWLEEMHIPNGIRFSDDANGVTPILDEISKLTCLRSIKISFRDFEPCQGTASIFKNLSKYVYGELWNALEAEGSSPVIGIYGMPGVGKTRMMEQVWKEAMEKKKFDKVVRANVGSEELNVIKLQDQIAADLDCNFDSQDNVNRRANLLKNSLMYWKKVLVIFDDAWTEIPVEDIIGADFGKSSNSKGSKILLTSRREDVCLKNKCQRLVHITTLTVKEAWDLFQKTVGADHINHLQDDNLAKKVCAKCAGLPLLIRAVGKALESMSPTHHAWNDALNKLEKGIFKKIATIDPRVYACVKLSIDSLQEDAKLCLFLCSLFPEDADIPITTLIQFAIGSQLIDDGESAIPTMVDVLTKSSLLLECDEDHITRMHDIIRAVSRLEASEGSKYKFFHVKSGDSRLTDNAGCSTSKLSPKLLRLDVEGDQVHIPDSKYLDPTDLNTLWLRCNNRLQQFPGGFFGMFVNLGFLILQEVHSLPEHFSLEPLGKLNMLIFDGCDIRKTDVRLFPKNLNTLCIWDCHLPSPLDLSNLNNLLRLDIQQKFGEVVMVRNAISCLCWLEEMHIPNGIRFSDDANGVTPILDEISKLTFLRSLKIYFRDFEPCQGTALFKKLSKYEISAGGRGNWEAVPKSTKIIELINVEVKRDEGIQSLLERAEKVTLRSADVDVSSISKSNREAFTDLNELSIESCHRVEYIARISQNEIWHGRQLRASFSKLTTLTIKDCTSMKYLFCKSVAKCLEQLQELHIKDCPAMEAIVMDEGTGDGEIIVFSKLRSLWLRGLKSFRSFYRKNKEMHGGSTDNSVICCAQFPPLFDEMVAFPSLENLSINSLEHTCIWGNIIVSSTSFCKLKQLRVWKCSKLESVIPVSMLNRLHNLEYLNIEKCSRLRNAFPPCIARDLIMRDDERDNRRRR